MFWIIPLPFCFPGSSQAATPEGAKPLSSLDVGDVVRVVSKDGHLSWSPVIGWLHREPQSPGSYLRITTPTRVLHVSEEHLIGIVRNGAVSYVQARKVQPGTNLLECKVSSVASAADGLPDVWGNAVQHIERVTLPGVFAPLTMEGTIIVDGVGASCYAATRSHKAAHTAMKPMRYMYRQNPEKMREQTHVGKRVPGSHKYVDMLARAAWKV